MFFKIGALKGNAQFLFLCNPQKSTVNILFLITLVKKSSSFCTFPVSKMVLLEIHERFKGHVLNQLRVSFKNFAKFTGKHLCQSLCFNKVAGLSPAALLKKRLWYRCFPVNFVKFLRTPFLYRTPLVAVSDMKNVNTDFVILITALCP